jgi:predicted secreted hydrolase
MKPSALASLLAVFLAALPGYRYQFPADHFNHPAYQTEWWYYTGNLHDSSGHRYGFELTFFRQALQLPKSAIDSTGPVWRPDQIYLAHLALTDIGGHSFYHTERLNRAGPGLAGADLNSRKYWNGNWQVYWKNLATAEQQLQAVCERFTLTLDLAPLKPPVIHGENGVSQKGPMIGEASHYISFTRLSANGRLNGLSVAGVAWMDHEFFTQPANSTVAGWDWFAIQLANNEELMLYRLRTKSGEISPYSSGTYIDAKGLAHHLKAAQIALTPGRLWHKYPVEWQIAVPSLGLQLAERPTLDNQEISTPASPAPSYWEGAVTYAGVIHSQPIRGLGYLEITADSFPLTTPPMPRNR